MKTLIVDDEQLARQRIVDLLTDLGAAEDILEAENGLEAFEIAGAERPAIVLMDIRMPKMDGLESAFHMAGLDPAPAIIFITAYEEHAVKAFEANAIDYLLKPVRADRLQQALAKAALISRSRLGQLQEASPGGKARTHLSAVSQGRIQLIPVHEIRCFKADQKYVTVYWGRNRETVIDDSLKILEEEYPDDFLRVHRNALVSLAHISALERQGDGSYDVILRDSGERLSVSRRQVGEIKEKLRKV